MEITESHKLNLALVLAVVALVLALAPSDTFEVNVDGQTQVVNRDALSIELYNVANDQARRIFSLEGDVNSLKGILEYEGEAKE